MDFDDLMLLTRNLLLESRGPAGLRATLQRRWRHVLVDEWQDTNRVQYDVIRLLCTPWFGAPEADVAAADAAAEYEDEYEDEPRSLTVLGDMDQSIYAFRGAQSGSVEALLDDFPGCGTLVLEANYRSTAPIAAAANAVMAHAADRHVCVCV